MAALDKLYLRCLTLEKKMLEHDANDPRNHRRTAPTAFMMGELDEPEYVNGDRIAAQLEAALAQLALVSPELSALQDTVLSTKNLDKHAKNWDVLRAEEEAQQQKHSQSSRELNEKLNFALEQYEKAGGPIYDVRINLSQLDEAFVAEALEPMLETNGLHNKAGLLCAKALASAFNADRLKPHRIRDLLFLPANEEHPAELCFNSKMSKRFWDAIIRLAKEDLTELFEKHGAFVQADQKGRLFDVLDQCHPVHNLNVGTMRLGDLESRYPSYHGSRTLALIPDHLPKLHRSVNYDQQNREASMAIIDKHLTQSRNKFLSLGGKLTIG